MIQVTDLLNAVLDNRIERRNEQCSTMLCCLPSDGLIVAVSLDHFGLVGQTRVTTVSVPAGMSRQKPAKYGMIIVGVRDGWIRWIGDPPVVVCETMFPLRVDPSRSAVAEHRDLSIGCQKSIEHLLLLFDRGLVGLDWNHQCVESCQLGV